MDESGLGHLALRQRFLEARAERPNIRNRAEVAALLESLARDRSLVCVQAEGTAAQYTSVLLKMDAASRRLWLDELMPNIPQARLAPKRRLRISGFVDRIPLEFRTRVVANEEWDGIACYVLQLPRAVRYQQQREHVRYRPLSEGALVYMVDAAARLWRGEVRDISIGGLCVRVLSDSSGRLSRGERVESCTVRLPAEKTLQCGVEIRHFQREMEGMCAVGARFLNLPTPQLTLLECYIDALASA